MSTLSVEVQKQVTDPLVILFELDFTGMSNYAPGKTSVLRCSAYRNGLNNLTFGGNSFDYCSIGVAGHSVEMSGKITSPTLTISSSWMPLLQAMIEYGDIRGARVTWYEVFRKFLDDGSNPDTTQAVSYSLLIDRLDTQTDNEFSIVLTPTLGVGELNSNGNTTLTTGRCKLKYRTANADGSFSYTPLSEDGCPWGNPEYAAQFAGLENFGTPYLDANDELAETPQQDKCSHLYVGCVRRFDPNGEGQPMPFSGVMRRKTTLTGDKC